MILDARHAVRELKKRLESLHVLDARVAVGEIDRYPISAHLDFRPEG